jgi:ATP-dependent Clp protease adaptor protein ClpS
LDEEDSGSAPSAQSALNDLAAEDVFARNLLPSADYGLTLCMASKSAVALPEVEDDTSNQLQPLYHVILLNDEDHTYDYVIEMLQKIFGFTESKALSHAVEVDTKGTTILLTCELEKAEHKRDLIHSYGPDWRLPRSLGSMAAVIEPAAG